MLLVDGGGTQVLEGVSLVELVVGATQTEVEVDVDVQTDVELEVELEVEVEVDDQTEEVVLGPGTRPAGPYQVVVYVLQPQAVALAAEGATLDHLSACFFS